MTDGKEASGNPEGQVTLQVDGAVARITFDRPHARNAMTWAMYDGLAAACDTIAADSSIHTILMRGAGGKAFVAGTDIAQFSAFETGEDGIAYEDKVEVYIDKIEKLAQPTVAVVEGWAVGGGLAIANACDFRIATPGSKFGVPIARTLGNCLSAGNLKALTETFGMPLVKRMLLLAEMLPAEELLAHGYLLAVVEPDALDDYVDALCEKILGHAPVTMKVTKQALRRLRDDPNAADEDLIRQCYGSDDFHHGVQSFVNKQTPQWKGR